MPKPPTADRPKPVMLCILDGWGKRGPADDNAIALAATPNWDRMVKQWPTGQLLASAEDVGLPAGQMGNSEVGHMNLGAGRVVLQDLPRIDKAIHFGDLSKNPELITFIDRLRETGGAAHLVGLLSDGGVHTHQKHIEALAAIIAGAGVPVRLHALLDGRDAPPKSGRDFMARFVDVLSAVDDVSVATVGGRYWTMDRDNRWERVAKGYAALVMGQGEQADDPVAAIQASYDAGKTDEFMEPTAIAGYAGMADIDGLLMANFRSDRAREILTALADPDFDGFERPRVVDFAARLGMVEYSDKLNAFFPAMFPSVDLDGILGQTVSEAGFKQLRIAETEKYAHVTFFLNGGREQIYDGEERILVPSPKVATYDLQPEMSAPQVTAELERAIADGGFDLIVVNYANGDMVGHTGVLSAAIRAAETIDDCLGRLERAITDAGGVMFVTADHGNCEQMADPSSDDPHTAHTLNPVPSILVGAPAAVAGLAEGRLADVAPTLLDLMGLAQPTAMTGHSLLRSADSETQAAE